MNVTDWLPPLFALTLAPLMLGVTNRTKAIVGGRTGQPLLQPYFDLWRLLNKGAVYSETTSWVFRAGPVIGLAAVLTASTLMPFGPFPAPLRFHGDLIFFAYLLGLARLFTVLAALDTGSAFEGMGASREVTYSALAEVALFLGLAALARQTDQLSLTDLHQALSFGLWEHAGLTLVLVTGTLGVVFVTENSRIPIDDPTTHLELTMIHEVMVLDHSGPDFAFILYTAALKLWLLGNLMVGVVLPPGTFFAPIGLLGALLGMFILAVVLGIVESTMARLRLVRIPELLIGAATVSALAVLLEYAGVI